MWHRHGHAARTCRKDMQHEHAGTCSLNRKHEPAACTYSMDTQHAHAVSTWSTEIQNAARTCSMNKKHEISKEMQQGHADILHMTLAFPSAEWPGPGFKYGATKWGKSVNPHFCLFCARRFHFFALNFLRAYFSSRSRALFCFALASAKKAWVPTL